MHGVSENRFSFFVMLGLVLALGYLSYLILRPFLAPIAWAVVFSIVFFPVYSFVVKYARWRSLAAGVTMVLVCVLILGPFSYFAYLLTVELSNVSPDTFDFKSIASLLNHPLVTPITRQTAFVLQHQPGPAPGVGGEGPVGCGEDAGRLLAGAAG